MLEVKLIKPEETFSIRKEVLRKNIDLPFEFKGDYDIETFHLGAFFNNELIGITTLMLSNKEEFCDIQYQLRGMGVLEKGRGLGIGKQLIGKVIEILKEKSVKVVWCNAREVAIDFYKKQGFKIKGNSFMIDKVGAHYLMYLNVK